MAFLQQSSNQGQKWSLTQQGICGHHPWLWSTQAIACLWVSMLCTGRKDLRWEENSKIGTTCLCREMSGFLQGAFFKGLHSLESEDWSNHASISCSV